MAWVRLHDGVITHPKIQALSDGAFRLWVAGLAYCQLQLTDGVIDRHELRGLGIKFQRKHIEELCTPAKPNGQPLWEVTATGFQVHDYTHWNDTRESALRKREDARKRQAGFRDKRVTQRVDNAFVPRATPHHTTPERSKAGKESVRRLAFGGLRLEIPKFLDEEFSKRCPIDFDLTGWYVEVDKELAESGEAYDLRWIRARFDQAIQASVPAVVPKSKQAAGLDLTLQRLNAPFRVKRLTE